MNNVPAWHNLFQHAARPPSRVIASLSTLATSVVSGKSSASINALKDGAIKNLSAQAQSYLNTMTKRILDGAMHVVSLRSATVYQILTWRSKEQHNATFVTPIVHDESAQHSRSHPAQAIALTVLCMLFFFICGFLLMGIRHLRRSLDDNLCYKYKPDKKFKAKGSTNQDEETSTLLESSSRRSARCHCSSIKMSCLPGLFRIHGVSARDTLGVNLNGDVPTEDECADQDVEKPFELTWGIRFTRALLCVCELMWQLSLVLAIVVNEKLYVASAILGAFVGHMLCGGDFEKTVRRARCVMKGSVMGLAPDKERSRCLGESAVRSHGEMDVGGQIGVTMQTDNEEDMGVLTESRAV